MIKRLSILILGACCLLFLLPQCKNGKKQNRVAGYITDPSNGLSKKQVVDSNEVLSQLVPEKNSGGEAAGGRLYRFIVVMKTQPGQTSDSLFYQFSYHSAELFGLVENGDTLKPVLSERMANGRKDVHSFTVLFEPRQDPANAPGDVQLVFRRNELLPKDITFDYQYKDINKALKTL